MTNELKELVARWEKEVCRGVWSDGELAAINKCITDLRAVLADQAEQAVKYVRWHAKHGYRWNDLHDEPFPDLTGTGWSSIPLYPHPPTALHGSDVVRLLSDAAEMLGHGISYAEVAGSARVSIHMTRAKQMQARLTAALAAGKGEGK